MTREEELDWLCRLRSEIYVYMPKEWLIPMNKALDMVIKQLEQEPTTKNDLAVDCISRQELLKIYEDRFSELQKMKHLKDNKGAEDRQMGVNYCINILKELPPVTSQESRWIPCSEKLPEKSGDYLVTVCCGLLGNEPVREVRKNFFCIYSKKWLYDDDEVIAWMPLPTGYEPQERKYDKRRSNIYIKKR